jgi:hypothetical protein
MQHNARAAGTGELQASVMTLTSQSDEGFNRPAALRTKMNTTNV